MTSAECPKCNFDNKEIQTLGNVPYVFCKHCGEPFINPIFKIREEQTKEQIKSSNVTMIQCHKCQGSLFTLGKDEDKQALLIQCVKCNMQGSIIWTPQT